ncbi:MAG: trigger factor [bacterium]
MKIKSQKREGNKFFFEVEEDYSSFQAAFEKAMVKVGKEIKVPGFRPGKAPREMIEKAVNPEYVANHAAEDLIGENYPKLIEETKIEPVDYPKLEIVQLEKDKPFTYKVTVEVYPEIKLGKYKGLKATKKAIAVEEAEVLKVLGNLQERLAVVNAEGKKDLLPLDDEFATKVSKFGTLAELKQEVLTAIENEKKAESESDLRNKLIAAASDEAKVEIPAAMVEREVNLMLDELKTSLAQSGLTLEDYLKGAKREEKEVREEMKKAAEIRVKGKVVLRAVAEAEKLMVSPEEIEAEIKQFDGKLEESVKKYVEEYLLRKKALDLLVEKASLKEEEKKNEE